MTLSRSTATDVEMDLVPTENVKLTTHTRLGQGGEVWTTWLLTGSLGAVDFTVRTGRGLDDCSWGIDAHHFHDPQDPDTWLTHCHTCKWSPTGECWSDGSALQASELWDALREDPDENRIWRTLADRYVRWIERRGEDG